MTGIKLKVMEALHEDAYKGIARIDSSTMKQLNVQPGDIIIIKGERESVAIVDRAYPSDIGESIIRIDGIIRRNTKTGIGEIVNVKKAEVKEAKKILIAPTQGEIIIRGNKKMAEEEIRNSIIGRTFVSGDLFVVSKTKKRRDAFERDFDPDEIFGDLMNELNKNMGMGGNVSVSGFQQIQFIVVNTAPNQQPVTINEKTELQLSTKPLDVAGKLLEVTYEDIGGLDEEIKKIREMVELPLKHPEIFTRLGIEPPKGVLLYGTPGTGKTLLAKAVANESEANFILLNGPEIMSKFYGESEKKVRDIFEEAEKNAPSIIFIDEVDAIAPKREESYGEVERRVVSQLLTCMDGLKSRGKVVVVAATNMQNSIDPALRRPGRFDREINISVPDKKGRLQILKIHTRTMPLTKDVNLDELASITHGFVGADLAALCKEAAMNVLRKLLPEIKLKDEEPIPEEVLKKLQITNKDFKEAMKNVSPSAMREVLVETPNIKWTDVGGLENVKQELNEAVEWPIKHPEAFTRMGISPPRGILLYGPPGTGKTLLAKAIANESEANFIQIKGPSLLSMWVGKSEEGVRKVFERARQVAPCIIFFDEIDSLASRRGIDMGSKVHDQVLNQLLAEMDGLEELKDVVVIGATNRPDMLDSALMRPGRFDRIIYTPVPDKRARIEIFNIHTEGMPLAKDVSIESLAEKTEGFVGADIEALCREAAILALRDNMETKEIKRKYFDDAMKKVAPSVTESDSKKYKEIETNYLRSAKASLEKPVGYMG